MAADRPHVLFAAWIFSNESWRRCDVDIPWETSCGGAAAATWIFRGGRVTATPWPRYGYSAETDARLRYERCCIEQWLAAGKTTSPMTGEELEDSRLRLNHNTKSIIAAFLEEARELGRALDEESH